MTGPDNNDGGTKPISVAELLAKNGSIGSPPVGGRRRRRRGNRDSVSVAELTGEIPILRTGEFPVVDDDLDADLPDGSDDRASAPKDRPSPPHSTPPRSGPRQSSPPLSSPPVPGSPRPNGSTPEVRAHRASSAQLKSAPTPTSTPKPTSTPMRRPEPKTEGRGGPDIDAKPELAPAPWARRGREPGPERSQYPRPVRNGEPPAAQGDPAKDRVVGAEEMVPDPYYADFADDTLTDDAAVFGAADTSADLEGADIDDDVLRPSGDADGSDAKYLQSYLRSSNGTLYSGQTVADDLARRGGEGKRAPAPTDSDLQEEAEADEVLTEEYDNADDEHVDESGRGAVIMHGVWVVLQSILAVAFGAGLFIAFDQLWKWNHIVALVLSVLVILGLVVGVRVVRKTEDIASTLIAVAVGALVTLGPLALLQSN